MMLPAKTRFQHRLSGDGQFVSYCVDCMGTVGIEAEESRLDALEFRHVCEQSRLYYLRNGRMVPDRRVRTEREPATPRRRAND